MPKIDQKFIEAAQASQAAYGVPASVALAQFALESGWGKHDLGANNYFGIKYGKLVKCDGFVTLKTREVIKGKSVYVMAKFAKFNSPTGSFLEHGRFLAEHPHLSRAMKHKDDPFKFIAALQEGSVKYATDPEYVQKLTRIINGSNLTQYDAIPYEQPEPSSDAKPLAKYEELVDEVAFSLFYRVQALGLHEASEYWSTEPEEKKAQWRNIARAFIQYVQDNKAKFLADYIKE